MVAWLGFAGVIGAALIGVFGPPLVGRLQQGEADASSGRYATIVRTPGGEGVAALALPVRDSGPLKPARLLHDGQAVEVLCQVRGGDPLSRPGEGRPSEAVPTWNLLVGGGWVNDVFTSLPNKIGSKPPRGIPTCAPGQTTPD